NLLITKRLLYLLLYLLYHCRPTPTHTHTHTQRHTTTHQPHTHHHHTTPHTHAHAHARAAPSLKQSKPHQLVYTIAPNGPVADDANRIISHRASVDLTCMKFNSHLIGMLYDRAHTHTFA